MKAFIFDLDGVLVFTDKFHYQAWKAMADRMGIYFDETINNRLRGFTIRPGRPWPTAWASISTNRSITASGE